MALPSAAVPSAAALAPPTDRGLPLGGGNVCRLFHEGDELYDDMLAAISSARRRVLLETYIYRGDVVGWEFAEALAERAEVGLEVRVHLDSLGSLGRGMRPLVRRLRSAGVEVRRFHPWSWRDPKRYNRRAHRKILVVDGETAYFGGFNIHAEASRRHWGERRWHDTQVRLEGPLVAEAEAHFERLWRGRGRPLTEPCLPATLPAILANYTRDCGRRLECLFADLLGRARSRVRIVTPYFVPTPVLRETLLDARARGVEVELLLPQRSDVPLVRVASWGFYEELLERGVRIYEYLPRMLHDKLTTVDGEWVLLGTANLDYRSLFLSHELLLAARAPELARALELRFDSNLAEAEPIVLRQWRRRPLAMRLAATLAGALRRWL